MCYTAVVVRARERPGCTSKKFNACIGHVFMSRDMLPFSQRQSPRRRMEAGEASAAAAAAPILLNEWTGQPVSNQLALIQSVVDVEARCEGYPDTLIRGVPSDFAEASALLASTLGVEVASVLVNWRPVPDTPAWVEVLREFTGGWFERQKAAFTRLAQALAGALVEEGGDVAGAARRIQELAEHEAYTPILVAAVMRVLPGALRAARAEGAIALMDAVAGMSRCIIEVDEVEALMGAVADARLRMNPVPHAPPAIVPVPSTPIAAAVGAGDVATAAAAAPGAVAVLVPAAAAVPAIMAGVPANDARAGGSEAAVGEIQEQTAVSAPDGVLQPVPAEAAVALQGSMLHSSVSAASGAAAVGVSPSGNGIAAVDAVRLPMPDDAGSSVIAATAGGSPRDETGGASSSRAGAPATDRAAVEASLSGAAPNDAATAAATAMALPTTPSVPLGSSAAVEQPNPAAASSPGDDGGAIAVVTAAADLPFPEGSGGSVVVAPAAHDTTINAEDAFAVAAAAATVGAESGRGETGVAAVVVRLPTPERTRSTSSSAASASASGATGGADSNVDDGGVAAAAAAAAHADHAAAAPVVSVAATELQQQQSDLVRFDCHAIGMIARLVSQLHLRNIVNAFPLAVGRDDALVAAICSAIVAGSGGPGGASTAVLLELLSIVNSMLRTHGPTAMSLLHAAFEAGVVRRVAESSVHGLRMAASILGDLSGVCAPAAVTGGILSRLCASAVGEATEPERVILSGRAAATMLLDHQVPLLVEMWRTFDEIEAPMARGGAGPFAVERHQLERSRALLAWALCVAVNLRAALAPIEEASLITALRSMRRFVWAPDDRYTASPHTAHSAVALLVSRAVSVSAACRAAAVRYGYIEACLAVVRRATYYKHSQLLGCLAVPRSGPFGAHRCAGPSVRARDDASPQERSDVRYVCVLSMLCTFAEGGDRRTAERMWRAGALHDLVSACSELVSRQQCAAERRSARLFQCVACPAGIGHTQNGLVYATGAIHWMCARTPAVVSIGRGGGEGGARVPAATPAHSNLLHDMHLRCIVELLTHSNPRVMEYAVLSAWSLAAHEKHRDTLGRMGAIPRLCVWGTRLSQYLAEERDDGRVRLALAFHEIDAERALVSLNASRATAAGAAAAATAAAAANNAWHCAQNKCIGTLWLLSFSDANAFIINTSPALPLFDYLFAQRRPWLYSAIYMASGALWQVLLRVGSTREMLEHSIFLKVRARCDAMRVP